MLALLGKPFLFLIGWITNVPGQSIWQGPADD